MSSSASPQPLPQAAAAAGVGPPPASLSELFFTFTRLALHGFGGVLPWAQRVIVDERRWLSQAEFVEMLAFAQLMPGPNICNLSMMVGDRYFGWRGAAVSLAGMLVFPAILVVALAFAHQQFAQIPWVQRAVSGMAAVAAGLLIATGVKLAYALAGRWRWLAFGVAAFVGIAILRWPLVVVLALLGPLAVSLAWYVQGRGEPRR
ncbi:MAG: chromate transporter [Burkholderiaceae bacterium]